MNELVAGEYDIRNYILIFIQLLRRSLEHAHKHRYTRINEEKNISAYIFLHHLRWLFSPWEFTSKIALINSQTRKL